MAKKPINPTLMTEVTIDGKDYPLYFGLDFIRTLDKFHEIEREGLTFGAGLVRVMMGLTQCNPITLQEVMLAATCTHKPTPPSAQAIELWLYEQDMEQLAEDFLAYLDKSPATKVYLTKLQKLGAEAKASDD